jgi:hypothetical protein
MRISAYKVTCVLSLLVSFDCSSGNLSKHELTCQELGFKRRTQAYGECVLELDQRENKISTQVNKHSQQQKQNQQSGDGSIEHQTCSRFGFIVGTQPYSDCRLRIDIAKREQNQRQAAYEADQQRYQEERRRYDAKVAELERQKEKQKGDAMIKFGLALMGGTSPNASENLANAGRQSLGMAPIPPASPSFQNFTITGPSGRITNCTALGNMINCF